MKIKSERKGGDENKGEQGKKAMEVLLSPRRKFLLEQMLLVASLSLRPDKTVSKEEEEGESRGMHQGRHEDLESARAFELGGKEEGGEESRGGGGKRGTAAMGQ